MPHAEPKVLLPVCTSEILAAPLLPPFRSPLKSLQQHAKRCRSIRPSLSKSPTQHAQEATGQAAPREQLNRVLQQGQVQAGHLVLRRKLPLQCHWLAPWLAGRMTTSLGKSASSQWIAALSRHQRTTSEPQRDRQTLQIMLQIAAAQQPRRPHAVKTVQCNPTRALCCRRTLKHSAAGSSFTSGKPPIHQLVAVATAWMTAYTESRTFRAA